MMNYHLLFYKTGVRIREYRKHLRTRRAYVALASVTYTNTLLFSWMMFRQHELLVDILFCLSSILIGVSVTGLYLSTPLVMLPDVVFKVSFVSIKRQDRQVILATCAFFFAVREADEGNESGGVQLALVMLGYGIQFYENYFLFNAIIHLYRTKETVRPPPEYNFFTITAPKNEADSQKDEPHKEQTVSVEEGVSSSHDWSSTPPPSYAVALAKMARQIAASPGRRPSEADGSQEQRRLQIIINSISLT